MSKNSDYIAWKMFLISTFLMLHLTGSVNISPLIDDLTADSILKNHNQQSEDIQKNFGNDFLLFLTPWNKQGFSLALKHAKRINYLCPVWFDLKTKLTSKNNVEFYIDGHHNVDTAWMEELKRNNPQTKIFPRIYLNAQENENLHSLTSRSQIELVVDKIVALFRQYTIFDGLMFDSPLINYIQHLPFDFSYLIQLVSERLGEMDKDLILSFMAKQDGVNLRASQMEKFFLLAHKILIMTYDYSSKTPGEFPLSPYPWFEENIKYYFDELSISEKIIKKKLMMGLPFYGYKVDYSKKSKDAITQEQYLDILKKYKPKIEWDEKLQECFIKIREYSSNTNIDISYPCLRFLQSRLSLADEYGIGLFVWEGGQGLDYFYELF